MAWGSSEVGHEIERKVEEDCRSDLVRKVAYYGGNSFSERVIERIFRLFFDNRPLRVERENL
jgi:hypothetical protein